GAEREDEPENRRGDQCHPAQTPTIFPLPRHCPSTPIFLRLYSDAAHWQLSPEDVFDPKRAIHPVTDKNSDGRHTPWLHPPIPLDNVSRAPFLVGNQPGALRHIASFRGISCH